MIFAQALAWIVTYFYFLSYHLNSLNCIEPPHISFGLSTLCTIKIEIKKKGKMKYAKNKKTCSISTAEVEVVKTRKGDFINLLFLCIYMPFLMLHIVQHFVLFTNFKTFNTNLNSPTHKIHIFYYINCTTCNLCCIACNFSFFCFVYIIYV